MLSRRLSGPFATFLIAIAIVGKCLAAIGAGDLGQTQNWLVTVIHCPEGGAPVCARITSRGSIHLLYDSGGRSWYTVSRDNGKTFDKAICTVDSRSSKPGLEFNGADMAVSQSGRVFVAMSTNAWKLKFPTNEWSLQFATLNTGASAFSQVVNLNNKSSQGFSLAADDRKNVAAVWLSKKLYANFSHDVGMTFSPNIELDSACDPCPCCTTSSVFGTNGDLVVLYRDEAENNRDMFVLIKHQDGRILRKRISSTLWKIDACPMSCFNISRAGQGYIAAWPTKGHVYFVKLAKDGTPLWPGEIATAGRADMHDGIIALATLQGQILVSWNHNGRLHWQVFDAVGCPAGQEESTTTAGTCAAGVVSVNGRFIVFN